MASHRHPETAGGVLRAALAGERESASVAIDLLGQFRVTVGSHVVDPAAWRLQKARSLVKLLALTEGYRLPRERVLDLLWPDLDPGAATNNLHQAMHRARRALQLDDGATAVTLRGGLVSLVPKGGLWVDATAFEAGVAAARRADDLALYHAALDLYTGDLLPEDLYDDWVVWPRERLRELYISTLVDAARRHEARGELSVAMELLSRAVEADPLREEVQTHLIRLYASTGQRGRALRQFRQLKEALAAELDAEPDDDNRTMQRIVASRSYGAGGDEAEDVAGAPRHNLPLALTSFIGRRRELDQIRSLLRETRLLTLVGVGGAGKTRLAVHTSWELLPAYRDGIWLVPLAALGDGTLLSRAVAAAIGLEIEGTRDVIEALVERLHDQRVLLLLDNCEHMVEACRELCLAVLTRCPEVQILATSRLRLGIAGEMTLPLGPLACPPAGDLSAAELATYDAVQLFVERARFRRPSFALTAATAPGIQRLCTLVEGVPLAIELAASRVGTLGVDGIAERLEASGDLLTSTDSGIDVRHRSLDATLDWSYGLLTPPQAALFRRLGVFSGGWSLNVLERLTAEEPIGLERVLETLGTLADHSLVVVDGAEDGSVRYRLLEPVRQYALRLLRVAGEEQEARRRHATVYVELAEEAARQLRNLDAAPWYRLLDAEHDNLRSVLQWSLNPEGDLADGMRIAGAIWRYWFSRGHLDEGRSIVRRLLAQGGAVAEIDPVIRAGAFNAAGAMAYFQSDEEEARVAYLQGLALRRQASDHSGLAGALSNLGLVAKDQGDHEEALAYFEEASQISKRIGDTRTLCSALGNIGILYQEVGDFDRARAVLEESLDLTRVLGAAAMTTLNNLGGLALEQGEYARARAYLEESLVESRTQGVKRSQAVALYNLAHVDREEGDPDGALRRAREGLAIARDQGESMLIALGLQGVAAALAARGEIESADVLLNAAGLLRASAGTPPSPIEQRRLDAVLAVIEAGRAVEHDEYARPALSTTDAIALALGEVPAAS
jgi:predicted ATPase/DNA-binding SARP family transcriptional activator